MCSKGGAEGTGVKHYYFIGNNDPCPGGCDPDQECCNPPCDVCETKCSEMGSNSSDEYLKCAEAYCYNKFDYPNN